MTEEKKYEFYDPEYDTYTFRGEVLRSVTAGFDVVYRSESYCLTREIEVEVDDPNYCYYYQLHENDCCVHAADARALTDGVYDRE